MEIVQAEVPDEEANEVLRRVHTAVQNMQQSSGVMDTNEQVHAQLDSGEVAILSGSGDSTAGWCLLFTVYLNISMQILPTVLYTFYYAIYKESLCLGLKYTAKLSFKLL